jgi:hypothetical protein
MRHAIQISTLTAAALAAALAASACGGSRGTAARIAPAAIVPASDALAAVHAGAAPPSWRAARVPSGAVLFYPPRWRLAHGDRGTATAIATGSGDRITGYLNLTPRQGEETLSGWASFRLRHNAAEGEREVRLEGDRSHVRFRDGAGTCVRDSYETATGARYVELACLVRGARSGSVVVGAAPPAQWPALAPILARSVSALLS